ncbi:unnamed protein product [Allacma fusca]|uniref:Uncharacterized protein n=1 Tax=Allacma fusca TaxID=39272 RepID=A0A8J2K9N0_9HEXA|nr:unnamed protein product [Allacma fusca]
MRMGGVVIINVVNTNPGLGNDCLVDEVVKRPMLHQLLTLLGLPSKVNSRSDSKEDVSEGSDAQEQLESNRLKNWEGKVGKEKLRLITSGGSAGLGSARSRDERKGRINKENDFPEYSEPSKYRPTGECNLGDWIRIFPFDSQSNQDKMPMSVLDIKMVITRMQNYLRIVDRIASKQRRDDQFNDALAKHYGHLSTEPWHPSLVVRS